MKFIEFSSEIINVNCIETIYRREEHDYFLVCIGKFEKRDMLDAPLVEILNERYAAEEYQENRYDELKELLCK